MIATLWFMKTKAMKEAHTFVLPVGALGLTADRKLFKLDNIFGITIFTEHKPDVVDLEESDMSVDDKFVTTERFTGPAMQLVLKQIDNKMSYFDELNSYIEKLSDNNLFNSLVSNVNEDMICLPIEAILYCAACLAADCVSSTLYMSLGIKGYSGEHNPYDVSWFEEPVQNPTRTISDILDVTKAWIDKNFMTFDRLVTIMKELNISPETIWDWSQEQ